MTDLLNIESGGFSAGTKVTGQGWLCSISATTDGANDATVTVYDNTSGSGTVLGGVVCPAAELSKFIEFSNPVRCTTGLTVVFSGTGAGGNITYATSSISQY